MGKDFTIKIVSSIKAYFIPEWEIFDCDGNLVAYISSAGFTQFEGIAFSPDEMQELADLTKEYFLTERKD